MSKDVLAALTVALLATGTLSGCSSPDGGEQGALSETDERIEETAETESDPSPDEEDNTAQNYDTAEKEKKNGRTF